MIRHLHYNFRCKLVLEKGLRQHKDGMVGYLQTTKAFKTFMA